MFRQLWSWSNRFHSFFPFGALTTAIDRLIYHAAIEHNAHRPKNVANAPQPTVMVFVPIQQQASITAVDLAPKCTKGEFFRREDLALDKVAAALDDPVLQRVLAVGVGKTILE